MEIYYDSDEHFSKIMISTELYLICTEKSISVSIFFALFSRTYVHHVMQIKSKEYRCIEQILKTRTKLFITVNVCHSYTNKNTVYTGRYTY